MLTEENKKWCAVAIVNSFKSGGGYDANVPMIKKEIDRMLKDLVVLPASVYQGGEFIGVANDRQN